MPIVSFMIFRLKDWKIVQKLIGDFKISIRFLTNEIRSDSLDIKVFNRKCLKLLNCVITEKKGNLINELKSKILKTAATYELQKKDKDFKPYKGNQKVKGFN